MLSTARGQAAELRPATGSMHHDWTRDCSDGVLLTSHAGSTEYDRMFMETFIRPGLGDSNLVSRTKFPLTGILPAGPGRIQMFVTRNSMQPTWHIERLLLRTDGFASLSAPWAGGEMLTKPLTFSGTALEINYRTSAAGSVRVEIQDLNGLPLAGFTAADCPKIIGDEIERVVTWEAAAGKPQADPGTLAGKPVRLRQILADICTRMKELVAPASWTRCGRWKPMSGPSCR